jgi:Co/Zn/Cd efflux system component
MEGTPGELDSEEITRNLYEIPNVKDVHDFHLW